MRRLLFVALLLAGCVEAAPPAPPSQAVQNLSAACEAGNMDACTSLAQMEQRERERVSAIPPPVFQDMRTDPGPFLNAPRPQVVVVQRPAPYGCYYDNWGTLRC